MTAPADTVRVFVALDLPQEAKATLAGTMRQLQNELTSGIRWVDPEGIHLTLKFLGDIAGSRVEPVFEAMRQAGRESDPFQVWLEGLGVFPNLRQPRVLWAGAAGDLAVLDRLQARVDQLVSGVGFTPERRPFNPHLTLGRVRDNVSPQQRQQIGAVMGRESLAATPAWRVEELHLIRSIRSPQGAHYTSLGSAPLGQSPVP